MDRKLKGVLLLAVVLFLAILLPSLQAKEIRGTAVVGHIPGAPRVGECLLQTPPDPAVLASPGTSYRLGSCAGAHFGEVAEVIPGSGAPASAGATAGGDEISSLPKACTDEDDYLGWSSPVHDSSGVRWAPIDTAVIRMEPTALQHAFGQDWVVCVVTPSSGGSYTGSVKGTLATGKLPSVFGQCASTDNPTSALPPVRCDRPHRFEIFGVATLPDDFADQRALDSQCALVVRATTRMPDASAHGQLTVTAVVSHEDADFQAMPGFGSTGSPAVTEATCVAGVTGTHLLDGTLFGLGTKPLPLM
jgi:hypothetical protein